MDRARPCGGRDRGSSPRGDAIEWNKIGFPQKTNFFVFVRTRTAEHVARNPAKAEQVNNASMNHTVHDHVPNGTGPRPATLNE